MSEHIDTVVIGAGVVGLATARALARAGREVWVLERNDRIGAEISSRNSEVIHAGIYYPRGSLKARLCVQGRRLLYEYLDLFRIPYRRCGKIIVATNERQHGQLDSYRALARTNGVGDLPWMSPGELASVEPEISCTAAIWSPETGIMDTHAYLLSLLGELEARGGTLALNTPVLSIQGTGPPLSVYTPELALKADLVVNAGGLHAGALMRPPRPTYYAKGHYYSLSGKAPFSHLIYPVAEPGGLGVHVTLDMAGQARFGPDVRWVDSIDYAFDDSRRDEFIHSIRHYYPGLDTARLQPAYTGIRPKLHPAGTSFDDFQILGPRGHGIDGLVHLLGIESPGLTASLAIAEEILRALGLKPVAGA